MKPASPDELRDGDRLAVCLVVERQRGQARAIRRGQRLDVVVEAGDLDPSVGSLERGDDRREGVRRVLDRCRRTARSGGPPATARRRSART